MDDEKTCKLTSNVGRFQPPNLTWRRIERLGLCQRHKVCNNFIYSSNADYLQSLNASSSKYERRPRPWCSVPLSALRTAPMIPSTSTTRQWAFGWYTTTVTTTKTSRVSRTRAKRCDPRWRELGQHRSCPTTSGKDGQAPSCALWDVEVREGDTVDTIFQRMLDAEQAADEPP